MGQYHIIVNLDKKEMIHPHKLASGLKAWEILASGMPCKAMFALMVNPEDRGGGDLKEGPYVGRWHGDRVVVVGDYAEDGDFAVKDGEPKPSQIYGNEEFTDISEEICKVIEEELEGRFVGEGWRDFVQVDRTVQKWGGTDRRELWEGKVTSLTPLKVNWEPHGPEITYKDGERLDFF